jgi:uncharacterized lipoprotein YmbA
VVTSSRARRNRPAKSEAERWAEPLEDALASTLGRDLLSALGSDAVVIRPWDAAVHPAFEVAVDVSRFQRVSAEAVELAARWTIRDDAGRVRLARESHLRQATAGGDARAAVAALSQALAALSLELATAIRGL